MLPLYDTVRSRTIPLVTWSIIALNVAVFLVEASLGPRRLYEVIYTFGLVPARFFSHPGPGEVATLFTSMFLHGGWLHLLSNMWALFIFGDNVEDRMGHGRYLLFYLLVGVVAALVQAVMAHGSRVPMVGASGAISGVLGAYLMLYPGARVLTLVPVFFLPWFVELPAVLFLGLWFLSQLLNGFLSLAVAGPVATYGGVAWWAHIGGFVAGVVLVGLLARRRPYRRWYPDEYWPW